MDEPSTSKADKEEEESDLVKSPVSNKPMRWNKILESFVIKHDPKYVAKFGSYRLISYIDIVKEEDEYVYNSKVLYCDDFKYTTGWVVAASHDDNFLANVLEKWRVQYPPNAFLLLQYRPEPNRLEHKVIHEKRIVYITALSNIEAEHQDVLLLDGQKMCQACVLTSNASMNLVLEELDRVKTKIRTSISRNHVHPENPDEDAATIPEANIWILVQYSTDFMECSHTIMLYEETLYKELNPYPGYKVIVEKNGKIYQGLILYKSHNYQEMLFLLHNIVNSNVISMYPHFSDMGLRQVALMKMMLQANQMGQLEFQPYICCLELNMIPPKND